MSCMKFRLSQLLLLLLLAACAQRQGASVDLPAVDLLIDNVTVIDLQHAVALKGDYLDRGALDAMLSVVRARVAARETEAQ